MMKYKLALKIFIGVIVLVIVLQITKKVVVEPLILKKIQSAIDGNNKDFNVQIGKVHLSILSSELELEHIAINTKPEQKGIQDINGEVASIRFDGIHILKAIFKRDIEISEVTIFNSSIKGTIPFPEKTMPPKISSLNIHIDSLFVDKTNLKIKNTSTAQAFSIKDGVFKVYHLEVQKRDTLSLALFNQFDFNVQELLTVSSDSMYTRTAIGINYSETSNILTVDSFSIQPNYSESEFVSRHQFAIDRIEAGSSKNIVRYFSAADYLQSGNLRCSYIEISNMDVNIFRDCRKAIPHVRKPTFQELIYNYAGSFRVDSIGILNGNIVYKEHAQKANEPGWISFQKINAQIYKITNDTIYKTEEAYLKLNAEALLMGKGKLNIALKGRIFDPQNTFSVNGTLSGMEVNELNPILEKNAFVYATAGKIDAMKFSFLANNTNATGQMTLRYHGLNVAVKNKRTDDTTAIKERFMSIIANKKILDSNPVPGEPVRVGVIDYKRDPERFLFNYSFKSILSGIKSSLTKESGKGKN
jgi:hypothetical protein